jgi:dTMP kinase
MQNKLAGKWLALDGTDAVGKSTQVSLLGEKLRADGRETLILPEFSNSPVGRTIQSIIDEQRFYSLHTAKKTPYADTYALIADMAYHVESGGHEVMTRGGTVLSDRGLLSLIGYQAKRVEQFSDIAKEAATDRITQLVKQAMGHLHLPDLHVLLVLNEGEMQKRIVHRGETPLTEDDLSFMRGVRQIMERLSNTINSVILDVSALNEEETTTEIIRVAEGNL